MNLHIEKPALGKPDPTNPQTIHFVLRLHYRHINRAPDAPIVVDRICHKLEEMIAHAHKEKRRRSHADKATSAEYRQVLTDYGRQRIEEDRNREDWWWGVREESYKDAIDGKWFNIF